MEKITYYLMYNESTEEFLLSSAEVGPYVYLFLLPEGKCPTLRGTATEGLPRHPLQQGLANSGKTHTALGL